MKIFFWICFFLPLYCYFGYPLVLSGLARLSSRPIKKAPLQPAISIVISLCNEEDVIQYKLQNLLSLDYPSEKMEILIGSDGSDDRTNEIIRNIKDQRIRLFEFPQRRGKVATLNALLPMAKGEIVMFNDARQSLAKNAVPQLVQNFADPQVGCVSGELMFTQEGGATARGINFYWNYEKFLRAQESKLHSMLGATGAIYAIRRELYTPPPEHVVLDDMFIPLKIVEKGFRAIFDEEAKAYDAVADSPREEHRRKARTLYGNYQIFGLFAGLFNPFKSPIALQLFSHKFLRVVMPFDLIVLFILNLFLIQQFLYLWLLGAQIIFYGMAVIGGLARHRNYGIFRLISKVCSVPYVFCLLNFSALVGFFRFAGGRQSVTWQKARRNEK